MDPFTLLLMGIGAKIAQKYRKSAAAPPAEVYPEGWITGLDSYKWIAVPDDRARYLSESATVFSVPRFVDNLREAARNDPSIRRDVMATLRQLDALVRTYPNHTVAVVKVK